ncbi:hypothetical protein [Curtobacterium sp. 9128]|uniref:hypothetical protein n=1 Tax=Curtobacterium sp. 9128 TaxID=1793722 RepID=UPI0011A7F956|nr:hypothetical protein [Curtobacterium sp. 9128]
MTTSPVSRRTITSQGRAARVRAPVSTKDRLIPKSVVKIGTKRVWVVAYRTSRTASSGGAVRFARIHAPPTCVMSIALTKRIPSRAKPRSTSTKRWRCAVTGAAGAAVTVVMVSCSGI